MADKRNPLDVYRCIDAFAVFDKAGVPSVYGSGTEVLGSDPILDSHGVNFELASAKLERRVEATSAGPGEQRRTPPRTAEPKAPAKPAAD